MNPLPETTAAIRTASMSVWRAVRENISARLIRRAYKIDPHRISTDRLLAEMCRADEIKANLEVERLRALTDHMDAMMTALEHENAKLKRSTRQDLIDAIDYLFAQKQGHCQSDHYEEGYSDACADAKEVIRRIITPGFMA